jgi:hypothetical protein
MYGSIIEAIPRTKACMDDMKAGTDHGLDRRHDFDKKPNSAISAVFETQDAG